MSDFREQRIVTPIKGEICTQYIRCGKRECKCQRGELHGPYYYHVWRDGARVRKVYVKSVDVEYMRACCRAYRELSRALVEIRGTREDLTRNIKKSLRRSKPLLQP
jgi:hypothetical protein